LQVFPPSVQRHNKITQKRFLNRVPRVRVTPGDATPNSSTSLDRDGGVLLRMVPRARRTHGKPGQARNGTYFSLLLAGRCGPIPRSGINKIARGNHPWFQTHNRSTLKGLKKTAAFSDPFRVEYDFHRFPGVATPGYHLDPLRGSARHPC
jgi:hypothetical protein